MTAPVTPRQKEETSCSFLGNQRNKRIDVYRSVQPDPRVGTSRRCICTGRTWSGPWLLWDNSFRPSVVPLRLSKLQVRFGGLERRGRVHTSP